MRTADIVELKSTDFVLRDVPFAAFIVVIQFHKLRGIGQVDHIASVRPCPEYHRTLLNTQIELTRKMKM